MTINALKYAQEGDAMDFRKILTGALIAVMLILGVVLCMGCGGGSTEEIQAAANVALEAQAAEAIERIQRVSVVFDPLPPTSPTCWAVYINYAGNATTGSVSYIPCQVGRNRMAPSQRKALTEAEAKLGHPIP